MVVQAALAALLSRSGARHRHPDRRAQWRAAPTRRPVTWWASSSTPWCSGWTWPTTPASPSCWTASATPTWPRTPIADLPFERVVELLNPARSAGAAPAVPGHAGIRRRRRRRRLAAARPGRGRRSRCRVRPPRSTSPSPTASSTSPTARPMASAPPSATPATCSTTAPFRPSPPGCPGCCDQAARHPLQPVTRAGDPHLPRARPDPGPLERRQPRRAAGHPARAVPAAGRPHAREPPPWCTGRR